jgi:hypothetical protein
MLWISNVYPPKYEDKCAPWTFFMPLYVQLTLTLPLVVGFYKCFQNKLVGNILMMFLSGCTLFALFAWIYSAKIGGSMIYNDEYFNLIYMNPLTHWFTFYIGIFSSIIYNSYRESRENQEDEAKISEVQHILDAVCSNAVYRYPLYIIGLGGMIGVLFW